jgi:hypothetical protein
MRSWLRKDPRLPLHYRRSSLHGEAGTFFCLETGYEIGLVVQQQTLPHNSWNSDREQRIGWVSRRNSLFSCHKSTEDRDLSRTYETTITTFVGRDEHESDRHVCIRHSEHIKVVQFFNHSQETLVIGAWTTCLTGSISRHRRASLQTSNA